MTLDERIENFIIFWFRKLFRLEKSIITSEVIKQTVVPIVPMSVFVNRTKRNLTSWETTRVVQIHPDTELNQQVLEMLTSGRNPLNLLQ